MQEHRSGSDEARVLAGLAKNELLGALAEEQKEAEELEKRVVANALSRAEREERAAVAARAESAPLNLRVLWGGILLTIGLIGLGYFLFVFDVSYQPPHDRAWYDDRPVATAGGEPVVNLGRMNDRTVGAMASGVLFLAGVICLTQRAQRHKEG